MPWTLIANLRGPRGYAGAKGEPGIPSPAAIANDTVQAALIASLTSETRGALDRRMDNDQITQSGHPRARKPLTAPIFTWANSGADTIYQPHIYNTAEGTGTKWALFYSTDHTAIHANSGIFRALANSPLEVFSAGARVFRDDVTGIQCETPCVWWDKRAGATFMTYQQENVLGANGLQTTMWARSADNGLTWVRQGISADYVVGSPTNGHTGYFRRFVVGGTEYGFSLYGGGDHGRFALWTRDDLDADSCEWTVDRRLMGRQPHLLAAFGNKIEGSPRATYDDAAIGTTSSMGWKGMIGDVIEWRGRQWWIGLVGPLVSGGDIAASRLCVAPLRADLLGPAEKPVDITPPAQAWEEGGIDSLGNVFVYNDTVYIGYRAGGNRGGFGIVELY